jgi:hypothetical protein
MITKHPLTGLLLLLASLLVAAPALAQRAQSPRKSTPPDAAIAKLTADLSRLGDQIAQMSELAALSALGDLPQMPDLKELCDLPRLPEIRELARQQIGRAHV